MSVYLNVTQRPFLPGSTVVGFFIDTFEKSNGDVTATGEIRILDSNAEKEKDRNLRLPWWAASCVVGDSISPNWLVRKERDKPRFSRDNLHDVLCEFIRKEILLFVQSDLLPDGKSTQPAPESHVPVEAVQPPVELPHNTVSVQVGSLETGETPEEEEVDPTLCVCSQLESSQIHMPFNWRGGRGFFRARHNYRCVVCVCGQRWWQYRQDKELWIRVVDERAWSFLSHHQGYPGNCITLLPGSAYHISTLEEKKVPKEFYVTHKAL